MQGFDGEITRLYQAVRCRAAWNIKIWRLNELVAITCSHTPTPYRREIPMSPPLSQKNWSRIGDIDHCLKLEIKIWGKIE
jgi:hypothetical protein